MRYLIFIFLVLNFSMAIYAKERSKIIKSVNINKAWKVLKLDNPELVEGRQLYFILELKHFAT